MGQLLTDGKPQEIIPNSSPLSIAAIRPNMKGKKQKLGVSAKRLGLDMSSSLFEFYGIVDPYTF
jgi:hypothetical protein